ncbi:MAG: hypothetical protein E6649_05315 [Paeniclostridium sordellii]|nr:hypothetical protein [Paeniclostridium sordellii]DAP48665.1 MAG TPA: hypothetical protein [Caudoviricetes sp.]
MSLDELYDVTMCNDLTFKYNDKCYVICLLNDGYNVGEDGNDDNDKVYKTFDDMIDSWIIQDRKLKDIVKDIKVI